MVTRTAADHDPAALQCRICGQQYPVEPLTICEECFGPLEPAYDLQSVDGNEFRKQAEAGPPRCGATSRCCPAARASNASTSGAGFTPLRRADNLGERHRASTAALDQGRQRQPIELLQGPCRERRHHHGPCVRVRGHQLRVDRQPRERHRGARREGRHALLRLRARRPGAGEDPGDRGLRRQGRRGQGELRRREPPLQRGRRGAAVGVHQREHAPVLRGGLEVARVRDGGTARLASSRSRRGPHRLGCAAHEDPPGVQRAHRDRRGRREALPGERRPARGMSARSRRRSRTAPRRSRR